MLGRLKIWLGLAALILAAAASAQQPDATVTAALASLTAQAGNVFAGEVTAIRPLGGVFQVEFRVDQNLKGSSTGVYILHEWAGLWTTGQPRYTLGERAILFLYPPSAGGLTSPVDGMEGILPLAAGPSAAATEAPALAVDLRRLYTRVQRASGSPMTDDLPELLSLGRVAAVIREVQPPVIAPIIAPIRPHPRPNPILQPTTPQLDELLAPSRKPVDEVRQLNVPL